MLPIETAIRFRQVATIFALFLLTQLFFMPLLLLGIHFFKSGTVADFENMGSYERDFFNILTMIGGSLSVFFSSLLLFPKIHSAIWGRLKIGDFLYGVLSWLAIYPLIFIAGRILGFLLRHYLRLPTYEQTVVTIFRETLHFPLLAAILFLAAVFLVPIAEEMLFRGYLQSWLKQFTGSGWAIAISSLLFSSFHISLPQGFSNLEVVAPLFILSSFLGYLYERKKTLLAPVALHMTFNLISVVIILINWL